MFCPKCGKELKPGTKFCNGCGAPLEKGSGGSEKDMKPKKGKKAPVVLLLVLAVLLLLGGGAFAAYKLDLFDSFWDPAQKEAGTGRDKEDDEEEDRKPRDDEDDEDEKREDEDDDEKPGGDEGLEDGKPGDDEEREGDEEEGDEGNDLGNGGESAKVSGGQEATGRHTRISDMPEETEPATTAAASAYQGQAGGTAYPAGAGGGTAQAYSDFTAPGAGNGAILETGAAGSDGTYMIPDSSSRRLSMSDLAGLSKDQLKIARNEIYARHGRMFDSESLRFYFNSKSWYRGTIAPSAFSEDLLSQVEKDNIKLIKQREASMP